MRLVAQGFTSKQIALQLGISSNTVNEYVENATAKLGQTDRRDAARLFVERETPADSAPEQLRDEPAAIAATPQSPPEIPPDRINAAAHWPIPFRQDGRRDNDLNPIQRLAWICFLAIAFVFMFSQLANGMTVLNSMLVGIYR